MHKLTGKQCRQARALLKWNVYDLSSRVSGINARRIESYERGMVHIAEWENDEMVSAFRKEGIQFNSDMDVVLKETESVEVKARGMQGEGAHIRLGADQAVLEDSTVKRADTGSDSEDDAAKPAGNTAQG